MHMYFFFYQFLFHVFHVSHIKQLLLFLPLLLGPDGLSIDAQVFLMQVPLFLLLPLQSLQGQRKESVEQTGGCTFSLERY